MMSARGFTAKRITEFEELCSKNGVDIVAGITELKKPIKSRKISLSDGPMAAPTRKEKIKAHKNRDFFAKSLGLKKLVFPLIEVQTDKVLVNPKRLVDNPKLMLEAVKNRDKEQVKRSFAKELGDAIVLTGSDTYRGTGVAVHAADCGVLLIASKVGGGSVAAVHSGWKGTRLNIVSKTLKKVGVAEDLGKTFVYVGPLVCGNCYEFGRGMYEKEFRYQKNSKQWIKPHPADEGKVLFDNRLAILSQLKESGVKEENIVQDLRCTMEDKHFYSVRRDGFEKFSSFALAIGFVNK